MYEVWSILVAGLLTSKCWTCGWFFFLLSKEDIFSKYYIYLKVAVMKEEAKWNNSFPARAFTEALSSLESKILQISWQFHVCIFA